MYVARLRIDGVRGFDGPRAVDLDFTRPNGGYAGWTVIAGRNGSGKSTLLRAIALAIAGNRRADRLDPGLEDWLSHGRSNGTVTVDLVGSTQWDAHTPGTSTVELTAFDVGIEWRREELTSIWNGRPQTSSTSRTTFRPGSALAADWLWPDRPRGWFHAGYGPFRRLAGTPTYQRREDGGDRSGALRTLFNEEAALTESVDWLKQVHHHVLDEESRLSHSSSRQLLDSVVAILNDGLLPEDHFIDHLDAEGLWLRRPGEAGPRALPRMSDGLRTVTALVLDIIRQLHAAYGEFSLEGGPEDTAPTVPYPGVVLIDEVDAHLHVAWQQRLGAWLKQHFPHIQFIVSTHSPYVCQAADENGLIRLAGPGEPSAPEFVDPQLFGRIVYGTGDDAVLSELFGLDSPYSEQARELRAHLAALELAVVTGRASDEDKARYVELRDKLASSPVTRVGELNARYGLTQGDDT